MDVSERRSHRHADSGNDLVSLSIGMTEIGARGLRAALGRPIPGEALYDVTLGAALVSWAMAARAMDSARTLVDPRISGLLQVPTIHVPLTWRRMRIVEWLRHRGRQARLESAVTTVRVIDILVPVIAEELIARIDVDALVRQHVDLEKLISSIPLDALVDQVDVDRVASRLDIDAVLDRIDLTAVVRDRLDVDAVVGAVDIDAVAARLDVDAVIERLDLPTIAQDVIDSIDLPVIIRESSGSMASEAVQGVRLHSIDADDAVHRALDRVLGHRRSASSKAPVPGVPPPDVEERVADPLTRPSP